MKLLLTSAGLTNRTLVRAALDLVGKPAADTRVLFVPTAANPIAEDKSWLVENLVEFQKQDFAQFDMLDIAGLPRELWLPRMEAADLICFGGGNEQYLAKVMRDSGLAEELPRLLEQRVYMGISAGSMVMGQFLPKELMAIVYPEEKFDELAPSLAHVQCLFLPHLDSDYFTHVREETIRALAPFPTKLYACDDESALKVVDGTIEVVGEGKTLEL